MSTVSLPKDLVLFKSLDDEPGLALYMANRSSLAFLEGVGLDGAWSL